MLFWQNFVCSVLENFNRGSMDLKTPQVTNSHLIQSVMRNLGGHIRAEEIVRGSLAKELKCNTSAIPAPSPLDLIVQNIKDSSNKRLSVHIARHLMVLNRSLVGLQLLNHYVRPMLDDGMGWHVLFGSCFPGDLEVISLSQHLLSSFNPLPL